MGHGHPDREQQDTPVCRARQVSGLRHTGVDGRDEDTLPQEVGAEPADQQDQSSAQR
jgi:hypothetical protein